MSNEHLHSRASDAGVPVQFWRAGKVHGLAQADPNQTLLDFLRAPDGLNACGTKEGCAEGDCGACTVVVAELAEPPNALVYRAINSCIRFSHQMDRLALWTVEDIPAHHPVQRALLKHHASQCGFCTPGFVMSLYALYQNARAQGLTALSREEVLSALSGNLCRCTGYRPIVDAALDMLNFEAIEDDHTTVLASLQALRAAPESAQESARVFRPTSLASALQLRQAWPAAQMIAGATDVGLWVTKQGRRFERVLDLSSVSELKTMTESAEGMEIGAAVCLADACIALAKLRPQQDAFWKRFAGLPIRQSATLGGNIANGSPIGDSMPLLIALGARVRLASLARGGRELALEEFFVGYRQTLLGHDEILTHILIASPKPAQICRVYKVSKRLEDDISAVCLAINLQLDASGARIESARLGVGGMAAVPSRAPKTEALLQGREVCRATFEAASLSLRDEFTPLSDLRATAHYRCQVIGNLLLRYWEDIDAPAPPITPAQTAPPRATHEVEPPPSPAHESAAAQISGHAKYIDDLPEVNGTLYAAPVCSTVAHGELQAIDASLALAMPGVVRVLLAQDIPGDPFFATFAHDEPIFAKERVAHVGQVVGLVIARDMMLARTAAKAVRLTVRELPAVLSIEAALHDKSWVLPPVQLRRGDPEQAMARARYRLSGDTRVGGQEHFYLEGQVAYAIPGEQKHCLVHSSTQHPGEVQHWVAHALGLKMHDVRVETRRMGGGFGGKETQAGHVAVWAALAAQLTGQPVKLRLDRDDDFMITGKRHNFLATYDVGFNAQGRIEGLKVMLASQCGFSADLSGPVNDRAMFHLDNGYFLEHVHIDSYRCKTHTQSNTAFRGFGGPQGMFVIETIVGDIARHLKLDALAVRRANLYDAMDTPRDAQKPRNTTPYGMTVEDNVLPELINRLESSSHYQQRREALARSNALNPTLRRGLALTPVKFGISFTATQFNQAGALVHVYTDGSVLLHHGGTEMGQGLHTKVAQVVAAELGLSLELIKIGASDTSTIPNASATAASAGCDLNAKAAQAAAREVKHRLTLWLATQDQCNPTDIVFANHQVISPSRTRSFVEVVQAAYAARVQLWSDGFYKTPKIHYDKTTMQGRPFYYFSYGAACVEVSVDTHTGENKVCAVDILHDVGKSINPAIDLGQIEGGFVQGMGWLTTEELLWNSEGRLTTHAPSTYKIPTAGDVPAHFKVELWQQANREDSILGSKAVGEPPLMLALAVIEALRDAVASLDPEARFTLNAPATPPEVLKAIEQLRAQTARPATA
jgi:xanthine dehydrogenase molybdopterin binding subunit/xanthine dehydrogenase small subunit